MANGADMGTQYFSDESYKQLVTGLDTEVMEQAVQELMLNDFFSFSGDGATDVSKVSQETGSMRLLGKETMLPKDVFLAFDKLESENAEGVFSSLFKMLRMYGLSDEDIMKKMISLNLDGAAVNLGEKDSVRTRAKQAVRQTLINHCCNHAEELILTTAVKGHKPMEDAIATLQDVFIFYHYSPKKYRGLGLENIAEILQTHLIKFGALKNLRWLARQQRSWAAMYTDFEAVCYHLENAAADKSTFPKAVDRARAQNLLDRLTNKTFVMVMHLMVDVTSGFGTVSVKMQHTHATILELPDFHQEMKSVLINIQNQSTTFIKSFFLNFDGERLVFRTEKNRK